MPASTRQQSEAEERAATSAALEAAEEQAAQAAAAEQAAQDALGLERLAREEAEKAQAALEKRLAELESGFESAGSEEEAAAEEEAGPALSADAILRKFADARTNHRGKPTTQGQTRESQGQIHKPQGDGSRHHVRVRAYSDMMT